MIRPPVNNRAELRLDFELNTQTLNFPEVLTTDDVEKEEVGNQFRHLFIRLDACQAGFPGTENILRAFWWCHGWCRLLCARCFRRSVTTTIGVKRFAGTRTLPTAINMYGFPLLEDVIGVFGQTTLENLHALSPSRWNSTA